MTDEDDRRERWDRFKRIGTFVIDALCWLIVLTLCYLGGLQYLGCGVI